MTSINCSRPVIGITMGDPMGIGPEILASALANPHIHTFCRPLVFGDAGIMSRAFQLKKLTVTLNRIDGVEHGLYCPGCVDIIPLSDLDADHFRPGTPSAETGRAVCRYISTAVDYALDKRIAGVATCPITKTALKLAGSEFHGHTEMIAAQTGTENFAMMLAGRRLKVVLVTIHIPLRQVPDRLDPEQILKTIKITDLALREQFNISNPLIAVAGLNPHAGEDGMFGQEEKNTIEPAVKLAKAEGIHAAGPLPPDTLFFHAVQGRYHAVVCMYHDQGLIPFKMRHFRDGVNTTLGLPIIRTSVDHGTAYDIAWKGVADPTSLMEALKLAAVMAESGKTNALG
ncbi:MAG: 4-hydroxythreonine-4-phosphate dehydrogenase PdxA [Thermodesulfobacteriota bacterium]|nr:4-hydroxythreonine-4-phosphate dehydrogenase PdxA [Thermodesulfobacteriota bacterium]